MTHRSDPTFWALHVVRIRGRVTTETVDAALGGAGAATALLEAAASDGLAVLHDGRIAGWSLTPRITRTSCRRWRSLARRRSPGDRRMVS